MPYDLLCLLCLMSIVVYNIMVVPIIWVTHTRGVNYFIRFGCATILFVFLKLLPFSRYLHIIIYYYYNDFSFHCVLAYFISREMRPNGNLYFPPFPEQSYMPEIHAATYKCALENPLGRIVSRESRIKAGTDLCKYLIFISTPKPPPCTIIRTCVV